jgi:valyl-tRNA synthetase
LSAMRWFADKKSETLDKLEKSFESYRISEALMISYKWVWDDFCNYYLEAIKPAYQAPISRGVYEQTIQFFEELLAVLHPFMPFITEDIWHNLSDRKEGESISLSQWPSAKKADEAYLKDFDQMLAVINGIRNLRAEKNIAKKEALDLYIPTSNAVSDELHPLLIKLGNLAKVELKEVQEEIGFSFLAGKFEFFVPAGDQIDLEAEKERLAKELKYLQGFLISVQKKLSNERFVSGAPDAVVNKEKEKQADAEAKIKALEESLAKMG